jgi:formamidopyrimidine-DNA glycosylase
MPELPEVETIRGRLEKYLVGHKVIGIQAHYKNFEGSGNDLVGGRVKKVRRFGKVLAVDLDNGYSLVIHIKLTGQLIYKGPNLKASGQLSKKVVGGVPGKHTHVTFELDKNGALYYNDVRRFGWIKVVKTKEVEEIPFIKKLGPEPFGKLTLEIFSQILSKSSRPIKIVLMDQEKIGGVGNIYANDALWLAKINPKMSANKLGSKDSKSLYKAILKVLEEGIKYGGSSELAYVTPDGKEGQYQKHTLAYGWEGEPCERCHKAKFVKYYLGGRGTYVCPVCQK